MHFDVKAINLKSSCVNYINNLDVFLEEEATTTKNRKRKTPYVI